MAQQKAGTSVFFKRSRWLSVQAILLLAFGFVFSPMEPAAAGTVKHIATFEELAQSVRRAQPGDVLTLAPGTYEFRHKIKLDRPGKKTRQSYFARPNWVMFASRAAASRSTSAHPIGSSKTWTSKVYARKISGANMRFTYLAMPRG